MAFPVTDLKLEDPRYLAAACNLIARHRGPGRAA